MTFMFVGFLRARAELTTAISCVCTISDINKSNLTQLSFLGTQSWSVLSTKTNKNILAMYSLNILITFSL